METSDTIMDGRLSRRTLLKGAGAVGLGLTLGHATLLRAVAATSESVSEIINVMATAEVLGVTLLGGAVASARAGRYNRPIPPAVLAILEAARAEEQFHLDFLRAAGARPLTDTITVPDAAILSDYDTFFATLVTLETACIAADMAAARELAALGQPGLVKAVYQIGTEEAEHRVLANYALGVRPANNVAFEPPMFTRVSELAAALRHLGFIGGTGQAVPYPGPGPIMTRGVTNTTPHGPAAACR